MLKGFLVNRYTLRKVTGILVIGLISCLITYTLSFLGVSNLLVNPILAFTALCLGQSIVDELYWRYRDYNTSLLIIIVILVLLGAGIAAFFMSSPLLFIVTFFASLVIGGVIRWFL